MTLTLRSSPYRPVLTHRTLRRVLPGFALSALGDGMAVVAVGWLAMDLAPEAHRSVWTALAVAAYSMPAALGALLLGPLLKSLSPARISFYDAVLRSCALGAIPLFYVFDALGIGLYVALLALSSLLHSWGQSGIYTLVARLLPERQHLAGNGLLSLIGSVATVGGPMLAGLLIGASGAVTVVAIDAATFAVLAVSFRSVKTEGASDEASKSGGFRAIKRDPALFGLLALSFGFFFLFGPVYVALPLYVDGDLGGSATTLAGFYTVFGAGAVLGSLLSGYLGKRHLGRIMTGIVAAFGVTLLPTALGAPVPLALLGFGLAGLLWPPYSTLSTAMVQRKAPPELLPQVLAAASAVRIVSVPLGTALGGLLTGVLGARGVLLGCAAGILTLGLAATARTSWR